MSAEKKDEVKIVNQRNSETKQKFMNSSKEKMVSQGEVTIPPKNSSKSKIVKKVSTENSNSSTSEEDLDFTKLDYECKGFKSEIELQKMFKKRAKFSYVELITIDQTFGGTNGCIMDKNEKYEFEKIAEMSENCFNAGQRYFHNESAQRRPDKILLH